MDFRPVFKEKKKELAKWYKNGLFREVVEGYRSLLTLPFLNAGDCSVLYRDLAQTLYMLRDYDEALLCIERSLNIDPSDEKSNLIALKCAKVKMSWNLMMNILFSSFKHQIYSEKIRDFFLADDIPPNVKAHILSQIPSSHRSFWMQKERSNMEQDGTACQQSKKPKPVLDSFRSNLSGVFNGKTTKTAKEVSSTEMKKTKSAAKTSVQSQELENYKILCKEAATVHQQKRQALELYQQAYVLARNLATGLLGINDVLIIRFLVCEMQLETGKYPAIAEAIQGLLVIEGQHARTLPAVYVSLAQGFTHLNRFTIGKEWVDKGLEFMRKGIKFSKLCYPETNIVIALTTRDVILMRLNQLDIECRQYHFRDAICRYDACETVNSYHIAPSRDIYFSDPDFEGCVTLKCFYNCELKYHPACWRELKGTLFETRKMADKDVVGHLCLTPDCEATISCFFLVGEDGQPKLQYPKDKNSNPSKLSKGTPTRSRRDLVLEGKMGSSTRASSISLASIQPSSQFKRPASPPHIKRPSSVNRASQTVDTLKPQNYEYNIPQPCTYTEYKKTIDKKVQTEKLDCSEKKTQTIVDPLPARVLELLDQINIHEKTLAKSSKGYEKLREKYVALKSREKEIEDSVVHTRNEERQQAVAIWKAAGVFMFNSWSAYAKEKETILRSLLFTCSDSITRTKIERKLEEWRHAQNMFTTAHEDFESELGISAVAHLRLELPQLPPYPEDILLALIDLNKPHTTENQPKVPQHYPHAVAPQPANYPLVQSRPMALPCYFTGSPIVRTPYMLPLNTSVPAYFSQEPNHPTFSNGNMNSLTSSASNSGLPVILNDNPTKVNESTDIPQYLPPAQFNDNVPCLETSKRNQIEGEEWLPLSSMYDEMKEIIRPTDEEKLWVKKTRNGDLDHNKESAVEFDSTGKSMESCDPELTPTEINLTKTNNVSNTALTEEGFDKLTISASVIELKKLMKSAVNLHERPNGALDPDELEKSDPGTNKQTASAPKMNEYAPGPNKNKVTMTDFVDPAVITALKKPVDSAEFEEISDPAVNSEPKNPSKFDLKTEYGAPVKNRFDYLSEDLDLSSNNVPYSLSQESRTFYPRSHESVPSASNGGVKNDSNGTKNWHSGTPTKSKSKRRNASISSCSSIASLESLASFNDYPVVSARASPQPNVYAKLMEYLFNQFPAKSEDELRRCLEAIRKENRVAFQTLSLSEIVSNLGTKLGKRSCRHTVVQKFTKNAWGQGACSLVPSKPGTHLNNSAGECSICFDPLCGNEAVMSLKCSHVFHEQCLRQWLVSDRTCPLCREYVITQEEYPALC